MHFFIWCFSTASRHWSNLCLGFWIAWLLSFPCSLVSKWHIFYAWHFERSHPSFLHFWFSILLASRLPLLWYLQIGSPVLKNPHANCQLRLHLRTSSRLYWFLSGKLGSPSDNMPVPAEAIKLQIRYSPDATTRSGRSCQAVNPVHLRMYYPFRQKLTSCESGTSPDATTRSGRSSQAVNPVHLRMYYPFRYKLSNCKSGTIGYNYLCRQKLLGCKPGTPSDTTTCADRSVKAWSK